MRDEFVPTAWTGGNPKWSDSKADFPISRDIKESMSLRDKAHRKWMTHRYIPDENQHRSAYTKLRNKVKYLVRRAKSDSRRILEQIK